ncbi:MAG: tetratricopeptide repeat protein [Acidobacteriota bacterium]|nr:tetratricopeptide repeat protein [Acidobacteriota bacterium]
MDPISQALADFQEDFRAFRDDPEQTVLQVISETRHVEMLTKALRGEEWQMENASPMLIFPTPWRNAGEDVAQMTLIIKEHYRMLAEAFAKKGEPLPVMKPAKPNHADALVVLVDHIRAFALSLKDVLAPPLVCWLPTQITDQSDWDTVLVHLYKVLRPLDIRFVTVSQKQPKWPDLAPVEKEKMEQCDFSVDEDETSDYFGTLMGPPAAGRAEGTHPGCAAPDVTPPPRPGKPKPTEEEIQAAAEEAGLPPMLTGSKAEKLREHVLAGAKAAGKNDRKTAVERQQAACAICAEQGVVMEQVLMTMVLASYHLQFKEEEQAEKVYREAESLAESITARVQLAQIRMALGYLYLKQQRYGRAVRAYEQSAAAATIEQNRLLYFEALRLAGTANLEIDDRDAAILCWRAVVAKAAESTPAELRASGYRDVAGALIDLLHKNGLHQEAKEIEQRLVAADEVAAQPMEAAV